ncbi:MAG: ligase 1, partial [Frankiales bacterium]|nr:ligase 1 [Frankiales bacterium]
MLLADLAATSLAVAATPKRTEKLALLADALRRAGPDEVAVVASYLSGELRQRRTGVGWKSLQDLPDPAPEPSLTVLEVDAAFAALAGLSGPGSATARATRLAELWSAAAAEEQRLLAGLVSGELRQGASAGLLTDAVARAADLPLGLVRRALTLSGSLAEVATAALTGQSLEAFSLVVG